CSGIVEHVWWPVPISTLWVEIQPACPTLPQGKTCTSPLTEPRSSPWLQASSPWRSFPSRSLLTTKSKEPWTFTSLRS
ncbi:hypothetical protein XENOCAPTIV_002055, partial [Xenoophorus captivus]